MEVPVAIQDLSAWLGEVFETKSQKARKAELNKLRERFIGTVGRMIDETKDFATRETLMRVQSRASAAIVKTPKGFAIGGSEGFVTLGDNRKEIGVNTTTGEKKILGPDIITIGEGHLFTPDNKIKEEGIMTLFHEWCHGGIKDEFWTDVIAIRAGIRSGLPKDLILNHIVGRRAAIGMGGEMALYKFAKRKFFIIEERVKQRHLKRMVELGRKEREKEKKREKYEGRRTKQARERGFSPVPLWRRRIRPGPQPRPMPGTVVPFARRMPLPRRLRRPA